MLLRAWLSAGHVLDFRTMRLVLSIPILQELQNILLEDSQEGTARGWEGPKNLNSRHRSVTTL